MTEVTLYTKDYCGFCHRAKALLSAKEVAYTEIDVTDDLNGQAEMTERSGRRSVPQIFIEGRHVGGFDDLAALEAAGELDSLLGRPAVASEEVPPHPVVIQDGGPAGSTAATGAMATRFGVRALPTLLLLKDGIPVETLVGLQTKSSLAAAVERARQS